MRRLLVFVKEPAPGRAKTRLGAAIGAGPAADLARALLRDTLELARRGAERAGAALVLVHTPDEASPALEALFARHAPDAERRPQGGGGLGQRLRRAFDAAGPGPRVAIGSDAPDLPSSTLAEAFARLASAPAVLGPAPDGGYYLIGLGAGVAAAPLAGAIRWSHAETLADTRAALEAAGVAPASLLPERGDVDDLPSLEDLARRLAAAEPSVAAWTRAWLEGANFPWRPD